MIREKELQVVDGLVRLPQIVGGLVLGILGMIVGSWLASGSAPVLGVLLLIFALVIALGSVVGLFGFFMVSPNEGRVLQLFGDYKGTAKEPGLRWANPFLTKKRVSLRVRNFESGHLKVNDADGNPIEIAAIVVWKVIDTAEAVFHVDNYPHFVQVQTESAVRNLATHYSYDTHQEDQIALRSHTDLVADKLKDEIQSRLKQAGVQVLEARISHLAYAPEIAGVMLQRQQAAAIIAARQKIVEGAVGMVEMALEDLAKKNVVQLDEEKKAALVSNLLVVLCGERAIQPVISTALTS